MSEAPFGDHAQEMQVPPLPHCNSSEMLLVKGDPAQSRDQHSRNETDPLHVLCATSLHGEGSQGRVAEVKPSWQRALNGTNPP